MDDRWRKCIEEVMWRESSLNSGKEGLSGVWKGESGQTNVIEGAEEGRITRDCVFQRMDFVRVGLALVG